MYEIKTFTNMNNNNLITPKYKKPVNFQTIFLIIAVLISIFLLLSIMILNVKLYKIHGTSMSPTLHEKEIVLTIKPNELKQGDIISFYHNRAIMIKRIIALPGDTVDIKTDGTVIVNNKELKEDYIKEKNMGNPDITLPYTVPNGTYFVMGDNRKDSLDSRDIAIGCIKKDDILGKIKFSIIPFDSIN